MDLSRYAAATLHQDSEFVWCRGRAPESPTPHRPSVRGSIHRSEHPGRRPRQQLCSAGARALVVCLPSLLQMGNVALGRVIARQPIETLPLVAMIMNPRIMQFGLKLEF
jgi:hypothetical protein